MGLAFATRAPSDDETKLLRLLLSTYRDGTGNQREADGTTRANWREIERCVAELVGGLGGEDKGIFDVIAPDDTTPNVFYGLSVKSKQLDKTAFDRLHSTGRVYMEIANSPAKFWAELGRLHGLSEKDFRERRHPKTIGDTVVSLVETWHKEGKQDFEKARKGASLDLANSCYLCVSYSKAPKSENREYQAHSFSLSYPKNLKWEYRTESCLSAFDPDHSDEVLIDWYALSGGQLKYYPRGASARFTSARFQLRSPPRGTLLDKAKAYFPDEFR